MSKLRSILFSVGIVGVLVTTSACSSSGKPATNSSDTVTSTQPTDTTGALTTGAPTSDSTGAVSKAGFIAQADAICKTGSDATGALGPPPSDPSAATAAELPALAPYLGKVASIITAENGDLAKLTLPTADVPALSGMLAKAVDFGTQIDNAAKAATSGDLAAFKQALAAMTAAGTAASTVAKDYGFKVCGS